jgi:malonyl-CoA decarboxylase
VEVALTRDIPGAIAPILELKRDRLDPDRATTAVFYSISNCQRGLAGVSFGSFLIKQVVAEVTREMPRLSTFVTLSPVPNFGGWLARERAQPSSALTDADRMALAGLDTADWWTNAALTEQMREPMLRAAATYFITGRNKRGAPIDSVARFHLGNGARLERLNWPGDLSDRARKQSFGLMVNYLYDLGDIEKNHEAYAENRSVIAAGAIKKLARPMRAVVPANG